MMCALYFNSVNGPVLWMNDAFVNWDGSKISYHSINLNGARGNWGIKYSEWLKYMFCLVNSK